MSAAPARQIVALSAALALPLALLSVAPATAATVGVTTWGDLKAALLVDGDTVRLDADISANTVESLVIEPGENIILDLNGFALTITNPGFGNAAILVPATSGLTINANSGGTITAIGGDRAAGIGAGFGGTGGTITINGGTINATGGEGAAGIGGGDSGTGGTTTINGGTINATGGEGAAGIGAGDSSTGGTTTINGGTTTATGGREAAGIGGGDGGTGGTTTINGGSTTATGGDDAAGIGGGFGGTGGITIINGGTTNATGGIAAAGIGGGFFGAAGITTISGGTINATGGTNAAGIGGGYLGSPGVFQVNGTPDVGAATDGGGPAASPISNPTTPAGVGYSATTTTVSGGGRIELQFTYLITFAANGGSTTTTQTITDGDTVVEPAPPTREGFTFVGWTSEGSAYDFSTPVTEPLELTANWSERADDTPELADTGAGTGATTTLSLATLLVASGAVLFTLRRRTARHSA